MSKTTTYKYDTLTDTYTQLADIPYEFYNGDAITIKTDIYLIGGSFNSTHTYKYNTLTETYIKLTDIPYDFVNGSVTSIENNIYLFGSESSAYQENAYKYNITDFQNKKIVVQNKEAFKTKLTKQLQTYFNNAFIYDDNELKPYPCYWRRWYSVEKSKLKEDFKLWKRITHTR